MAAAHKLDATADEVRPDIQCDFVAFISMVPTDRGGRKSACSSGYRPQLFIDGDDCDVEIAVEDCLDPGASGVVYGRFFRPELHLRKLTVGKAVLLREGSRTIGYGTLLWRRTGEQLHAPDGS
jgi:translation elongation factor EF-Tu-like GTPase